MFSRSSAETLPPRHSSTAPTSLWFALRARLRMRGPASGDDPFTNKPSWRGFGSPCAGRCWPRLDAEEWRGGNLFGTCGHNYPSAARPAALGPLPHSCGGRARHGLKESPRLHFSNADVGLVSSAYLGGAVLGALLFGWLTDRLGRKRLFFMTRRSVSQPKNIAPSTAPAR